MRDEESELRSRSAMKLLRFVAPMFVSALAAVGVAGCNGSIGDPGNRDDSLFPDGDGDGDDGDETLPDFAPPAPVLRRILSRHYVHAVRDVLGPAAAAVATPPDVGSLNGFDSIAASTYALTDAQVRSFDESARAIASEAMGDPAIVTRVVPCTPSSAEDAECMRDTVATHGRRAFRRSLTSDELEAYTGLGLEAAAEYGDFFAGVEYVVMATMQSPNFLYLVEVGEPIAGSADLRQLGGAEIATRLSFFLADTTPSDALLDAALAGDLDSEAGVRAWAERLVDEQGAKDAIASTIAQVLRYEQFESTVKDPALFPSYGDDLESSMREETRRFVGAIMDEGGGIAELLASPETFVDSRLAALYGVDADFGDDGWARVTLPDSQGRGGLLGQAGFLAINAFAERTSPTRRGKVILESIGCVPPLDPPPGVSTILPDTSSAKTVRQRLELHSADPACAGCHEILDGVGFGFESYDAIGRYRTTDSGEPVDASSTMPTLEGLEGGAFTGSRAAGTLLAAQDSVRSCLVRNLFRAGLGHVEAEGEEIVIAEVAEVFDDDPSLKALLVELASSQGFRIVGGAQ